MRLWPSPRKNHQLPSSNSPAANESPGRARGQVRVGDFPQQCPLPHSTGRLEQQKSSQQANPGPPQPEHRGLCEGWKWNKPQEKGPASAPGVAFARGEFFSAFRRNKVLHSGITAGRASRGCCSVNGGRATWNLVLLDLPLSLPEGSQGRQFSLEAQTCLALSPPTPRAGIPAKALPGNLYTAPSEEIKGH